VKRVLVCGGRDFTGRDFLFATLDMIHEDPGIQTVIHGGARGADQAADSWARMNQVERLVYPADWKCHGRAAGIIRNRAMLDCEKPDLVLAFRGGRGTEDMIRKAHQHPSRPDVVRMWWPAEEFHLIDTGYACAVIGFTGERCTFAAPILARSLMGRTRGHLRNLPAFKNKRWRVIQE
jgi:hypothetical protein